MHRLMHKTIMVTGATGFIGAHLCDSLRGAGTRLIGTGRQAAAARADRADVRQLDLTDPAAVSGFIRETRPDAVVHLAADKSRTAGFGGFRASYRANFLATLNLVEACLEAGGLSRFLFMGSCEEYGDIDAPFEETSREAPVSAYGVSKLAATRMIEAVARTRGFPAVILRPSVVYGSGQGEEMFLPALLSALLAGRRFAMTAGEQTRDYVYVDDVVAAIVLALDLPVTPGVILNVSSGVPVRIRDLAVLAADAVGHGAQDLLQIGGAAYREGEPMEHWASNDRAAKVLGWTPRTTLAEGLRHTLHGLRRAPAR